MPDSDTAVSVRGLSKAYTIAHDHEKHVTLAEAMLSRLKNPLKRSSSEAFWALKDIEFDLKKGDVVGIIGRNGAGKSTLLKILSRITEPTTGQIDLFGRVGSLLEVGTGFHPELTGRENIYLNGAILGMNKAVITKHFEEIVDFAGVDQFLDTPVKRYSSGMYVRLAFAVAAHLNPEILIVDEVLAVGDAGFQKKCAGKMASVANAGRTVILVSHNVGVISALCKRAIWLNEGSLRFDGSTDTAVRQYLGSGPVDVPRELGERSDRQGSGDVRFVRCSAGNHDREYISGEFFTGDEVCITIWLEARTEVNAYVGVQLRDSLGRRVVSFNSREGGFETLLTPGVNRLILRIPFLPLLEGRYVLDGACVRTHDGSPCDVVEDIGTLEVHARDLFNSGAPFRAYHGVMYIPHVWCGHDGKSRSVLSSDVRAAPTSAGSC